MHVLIAGGSGFLGKALIRELVAAGHRVTVLTRSVARARTDLGAAPGAAVGLAAWTDLPGALQGVDGVVNLAGESIAGGRWTARRKQVLLASRLEATQALVQALGQVEPRPRVLVNASAVGYYGDRAEPVTEGAAPGDDFLASICRQWEAAAQAAEPLGVRVVRVRIGVVLAADGGALQPMLLPFRLFAGGPLGSGRQGFPWVHRDDVVGLMRFALEDDAVTGALNAVAPEQQTNASFSRALARALRRPYWLPAPAFALRLLLGEMADALLLSGQFVLPEVAQQHGYSFRYPEVTTALRDVLG